MVINYSNPLEREEILKIEEIASACGIMFDTARLLYGRKIDTPKKANRFLNPSVKNFYNPFLLANMDKATKRINQAKEQNENVLIFGDYDADGICATTILYNSLMEFGLKARCVVPERENGYGLNLDLVLKLNQTKKIDLIITVDCGVSDKATISQLQTLGIDVIVTDHHEIPEELPNCLVINPKMPNQSYPFDGLCGAGVAFKLACALIGEEAYRNLDFVALATVADSMELVDENRDLVSEGLKLFNTKNVRPAFTYLIGESDKKVTVSSLAYTLAPRINAGGRMQDANTALKLFTTNSLNEIFEHSTMLNTYNYQRQAECDRVYASAKEEIIANNLQANSVIIVRGDDWNAGVSGIVASRLVEDYHKPSIVFASSKEGYKGSCRSVDGINIYDIINASKEYTKAYGGHAQAAGVSIDESQYGDFVYAVLKNFDLLYERSQSSPSIDAEWNIDKKLDINFAKEMELLEPFGIGNKKPIFTTEVLDVPIKQLKRGSPHYSFNTDCVQMLYFNGEKEVVLLSTPTKKKIVFDVNYSVFKGVESIKGFVKDIVVDYSDANSLKSSLCFSQLSNLASKEFSLNIDNIYAQSIENEDVEIEDGYGTLYVINDADNLKHYPQSYKLERSLFKASTKTNKNALVYSLTSFPYGYDKVVYLDKPITIINGIKTQVVKSFIGYEFVKELSVDRKSFTNVYEDLLNLVNKEVINLHILTSKLSCNESILQKIFAVLVFNELGFFTIENGYLKRNIQAKSPLTNSTIYSTISNIKGKL